MRKELLHLVPKHILCPYCGKWHKWTFSDQLGYYDSTRYIAKFECANMPLPEGRRYAYRMYFYDGYLNYSIESMCKRAYMELSGKIPISSIVEDPDKPIVTFDIEFTSSGDVGSYECRECTFKDHCNCVRLGDEGDKKHMTITMGFEFEQSEYNKYVGVAQQKSIDNKDNLKGNKQLISQKVKEETTMANNNLFNMNMEFGPNKDENIASTIMGVAVKNGDSWRIYDKKKKEITDIGDMQLGNLPIFIIPTTELKEGDLIKDSGEYYFVVKVDMRSTQTLCVKTGEMKTVIPIKNILGFSCYSKVIAFSDSIESDCDFDVEKMVLMSTMMEQSGEDKGQMNQLLPLMLMKDNDCEDDDMMKTLLMASMLSAPAESGQNTDMNQLLPIMLLKGNNCDDDMMKMILMSSMMRSNNPVMGYMMLDMFKDKKKKERFFQKVEQFKQENKLSEQEDEFSEQEDE